MFSKKWIVALLEVDDIFSFSTMATEVSSLIEKKKLVLSFAIKVIVEVTYHDVSIASVRSPL